MRLPAVAVLALCACDPAAGAQTCPFDQTVRLVELPASVEPSGYTRLSLVPVGDLLGYRIGDDTEPTLLEPCTGAVAPYDADFVVDGITTPHGPILYGMREDGAVFVLDRRDVPGFDEPMRIEGPTAIERVSSVTGGALLCTIDGSDAGSSCWLHDGDLARPAIVLGDSIDRWSDAGPRMIVRDINGELRSVDVVSGEVKILSTRVTRYALATPPRHVVYETPGAGDTVDAHRLDLQTGVDIVLAQGLTPDAREWIFNGDGTAVGRVGEAHSFEAVFRLDSGAALAVPEHVAVFASQGGPEFDLLLDDLPLHVRAFWDPFTSTGPKIWFSEYTLTGGGLHPERSGDLVVYSMTEICEPTQTMWRVDLSTGERVELARSVLGSFIELDDGRYLTSVGEGWTDTMDIVIIDPDTLDMRVIATAVDDWYHAPGQGIFYGYAQGEQAGIWAAPVPLRDPA